MTSGPFAARCRGNRVSIRAGFRWPGRPLPFNFFLIGGEGVGAAPTPPPVIPEAPGPVCAPVYRSAPRNPRTAFSPRPCGLCTFPGLRSAGRDPAPPGAGACAAAARSLREDSGPQPRPCLSPADPSHTGPRPSDPEDRATPEDRAVTPQTPEDPRGQGCDPSEPLRPPRTGTRLLTTPQTPEDRDVTPQNPSDPRGQGRDPSDPRGPPRTGPTPQTPEDRDVTPQTPEDPRGQGCDPSEPLRPPRTGTRLLTTPQTPEDRAVTPQNPSGPRGQGRDPSDPRGPPRTGP
ncbi:proline-rich receptor-like protein kinase PERK2 [Choloepus didactylus]|uniref:proline-rich receptor-like protein kinase PERK2 n=1 Tax=Choloepus didactylus TaxID=27675 RepID=UPI0018A01645|nr:proline-rich receptor-like protein kinase PERK2 [Choloepus didactylus]